MRIGKSILRRKSNAHVKFTENSIWKFSRLLLHRYYTKTFLHFYFHIDYTFNVVRNECIQMERLEFV